MFCILLSLIVASIEDIQICRQNFVEVSEENSESRYPVLRLSQALSFLRDPNVVNPEAIRVLTELADQQNNADAQCVLGICFLHGWGMSTKDPSLAVRWLTRAALQNHAEACKNLGIMYAEGIGTATNYHQAFVHLQKAIESGNHAAERILGTYYIGGKGTIEQDAAKAVELLQKAEEGGDPIALHNLGVLSENGFGPLLLPNINKACDYYQKAGEKGYNPSRILLLQFFEKNKRLADTGSLEAACIVGYMYHNGFGVTKNEKEAFRYTKLAADAGNIEAQHNLGIHYLLGYGIESPNEEMALASFSVAGAPEPNRNYAPSQLLIAKMLLEGKGEQKNEQKAFHWMKLAADQGDPIALTNLGVMCFYGIGTTANEKLARFYLEAAIENGRSEAQEILRTLDRKKSPDSIELSPHRVTTVTGAMYHAFQSARSAVKYVMPGTSKPEEEVKLLKDGEFTDIEKERGIKQSEQFEGRATSQVFVTGFSAAGLRHRKMYANASLRESEAAQTYVDEQGYTSTSSRSSSSGTHDSPQELRFLGSPRVECQQAIDELRPHAKLRQLMEKKQYDKYTVVKVISKITQKHGNGVKVARAIGVDLRRISDLKNHPETLCDTSPVLQKARTWIKETPFQQITELTGVTEKELGNLF